MYTYLNSFFLCHFIQDVLNRMQMKFCLWSRRYLLLTCCRGEEEEEEDKEDSYTELCVAPSDIHISQPGNGRKNKRVGVIFVSVDSFLLCPCSCSHFTGVTRFSSVTCGGVTDTSPSYLLMWGCVTAHSSQAIVLHF